MTHFFDDYRAATDELDELLERSRVEYEEQQRAGAASSSRTTGQKARKEKKSTKTPPIRHTSKTSSTLDNEDTSRNDVQKLINRKKKERLEIAAELQELEAEIQKMQKVFEVRKRDMEEIEREIRRMEQNASGPTNNDRSLGTDYTGSNFVWLPEMKRRMGEVFGIRDFRSCQQGACNANMSGRDIIVVMPTGGGKSLTYQLPALLTSGCTLVISPLISLIQDQCMHLTEANVQAVMLTSATPKAENDAVAQRLRMMAAGKVPKSEEIKLCYVTPERVSQSKTFKSILDKLAQSGMLARIVIDEAHCVSSLGHDFRPDYQKLGVLRTLFPNIPIMCLSATCPQRVMQDLIKALNLKPVTDGKAASHDGTVYFSAPLYRPNLHYTIRHKPSKAQEVIKEIANYIREYHKDETGIIYCLSKKDTESVAEGLSKLGMKTGTYHANIQPIEKQRLHERWRNGSVKVVCATIAFGLGIDKGDVRFVIHHSPSKTIDGFYQETGRAGRDGKDANCVLFYRPQDAMSLSSIAYSDKSGPEKLRDMLEFAQNLTECRKILFAKYLATGSEYSISAWSTAEKDVYDPCGTCDNCTRAEDEYIRRDVTREAWQLLKVSEFLHHRGGRVTLGGLAKAARQVGGGVAASSARKRKARADGEERIDIDLDQVCDGKVMMTERDTEVLLVHLITQQYLQQEYHQTAYTTNVYLKPSDRAIRLTIVAAEDLDTQTKLRLECSFPRIPRKRNAKTVTTPTATTTTPTTKGSTDKGKQKVQIPESDEEIDDCESLDDFIVPDDPMGLYPDNMITDPRHIPVVDDPEDLDYSDDEDEEDGDWHYRLTDIRTRKRTRTSSSVNKLVVEDDHEVVDLCSD